MELTLYSALALSAPFAVLLKQWQQQQPEIKLSIRWHPSTIIEQEIRQGAKAEAIIATVDTVDRLTGERLLHANSRVEVVDSPIGIAVKSGADKPDISSREHLVASLLAARSVAWSEAGASGHWFSQLIKQLNIDEQLRACGTVIPAGFTAEQLVNGKADIAVQQISELLMVPGIDIVGPLPPGTQQPISLSAAVLQQARYPQAAATFLAWLKTPSVTQVFNQFGMLRRD